MNAEPNIEEINYIGKLVEVRIKDQLIDELYYHLSPARELTLNEKIHALSLALDLKEMPIKTEEEKKDYLSELEELYADSIFFNKDYK